MPVFDFTNTPGDRKETVCTYTTFQSGEREMTPEKPVLILDNRQKKWKHHSCGVFTNPVRRTAFELSLIHI